MTEGATVRRQRRASALAVLLLPLLLWRQVCAIKKVMGWGWGEGERAKKRLQTIPNWKLLNSAFFACVFFSSLLSRCYLISSLHSPLPTLSHTVFPLRFQATPSLWSVIFLSASLSCSLALPKCLSFVRLVQIGTWISFRMTFAPSRVNCSQRRQST